VSGVDLNKMQRLVIKIGSSLLMNEDGRLDRDWLSGLAADIAFLHATKQQLLIVSSGAIAIGSTVLGINPRRSRLEELQAAAAAGQVQLVHAYQEALGDHGIAAAQVLLTLDDTENRRRFLNAKGTLNKLLEHRVVPVINENDTVATEEIRYGDNDRLAARVAQMVMADGLLLLSDVDGFATHAGCSTIVASGSVERPLHALASGGKHTIFNAEGTPAAARKQWLAGILEVRGELRLDPGAVTALVNGNSLLPVGLVEVVGNFRRGDAVTLVGSNGEELGRGLAAYASDEATEIIGCRTEQIEPKLGYRGRAVMVHRDDLVLFGG
jgi:glutamate 5-kinase